MQSDEIPDINDPEASETISDAPIPKRKSPLQHLAQQVSGSVPPPPPVAPNANPPLMDEASHQLQEELKRCNQLRLEAEVGAQREKQKAKESLDMISKLNTELTQLKRENFNLKSAPKPLPQVLFQSPDADTIKRLEEEIESQKDQRRGSERLVTKLVIGMFVFAAVAGSLGYLAWNWRPSNRPILATPDASAAISAGDERVQEAPQPLKSRRKQRIIVEEEPAPQGFHVIVEEPKK